MAEKLVTVEVFGDKHLINTMNSWAMRAGHAMPAYEAQHEYAMSVVDEQFETEGASGAHGPWDDWIEGSRSAKESSSLLDRTGALRRSLTDANDPNHRFIMTRTGWAMGTTLIYMQFHQTGTKNMKQRRVIDFTFQNRQVMVEILHQWITRAGLTPVGAGVGFRVRGTRGRFIS